MPPEPSPPWTGHGPFYAPPPGCVQVRVYAYRWGGYLRSRNHYGELEAIARYWESGQPVTEHLSWYDVGQLLGGN